MNLPSPSDWEIEPSALKDWFAEFPERPQPRIIDCREEDEFAICRIEGAELIPLSRFATDAPARLSGEEGPIVIYCHHGMRSLHATRFLRERGLGKCWSLAGGIERWATEIDESIPRY